LVSAKFSAYRQLLNHALKILFTLKENKTEYKCQTVTYKDCTALSGSQFIRLYNTNYIATLFTKRA
ncbi:hypothetical protein MT378_22205, partial [Psychrobacter sp. 16-Bac2893]